MGKHAYVNSDFLSSSDIYLHEHREIIIEIRDRIQNDVIDFGAFFLIVLIHQYIKRGPNKHVFEKVSFSIRTYAN